MILTQNMMGFKPLLSKNKSKPEPIEEAPAAMVCIDSKQFPEVKEWKLGKEYMLKFRFKSKMEDDDGHVHGDFELVGVKDGEESEQLEGEEEEGEENEEYESS